MILELSTLFPALLPVLEAHISDILLDSVVAKEVYSERYGFANPALMVSMSLSFLLSMN